MPTRYRPEFDHQRLDWACAFERIGTHISTHRQQILEALGFYDEYGRPEELDEFEAARVEAEAQAVLDEIEGILFKSVAHFVDGGFAPTKQTLATLQAIVADPAVLLEKVDAIEPGALALIAIEYAKEGRHPYDLTGETGRTAALDAVRVAAESAIRNLAPSIRRGPPARPGFDVLRDELGGIFRQWTGQPVRRVVATETSQNGLRAGAEYGRFKEFLDLVLPPLEDVLSDYSSAPGKISRDSLVRKVIAAQKQPRQSRSVQHT